jgi:hypothetical protein
LVDRLVTIVWVCILACIKKSATKNKKTVTRVILISFCFIVTFSAMAQLAIIDDNDGYINVRKGKSSSSEIIGRLFNDDVFLFAEEDHNDEWINIFYYVELDDLEPFKRDYYVKDCHWTSNFIYFNGYVHKSRVLPLESLNDIIKNRQLSNGILILKNDSITFNIMARQFISAQHHIQRDDDGWVEKIDGKQPRGVDGGLPKIGIKSLSLVINSNIIEIPKEDYADLYEPNLRSLKLYTDKRGVIYIYMPSNSDGAGGYDAIWIIKEKKYLKRYVDSL